MSFKYVLFHSNRQVLEEVLSITGQELSPRVLDVSEAEEVLALEREKLARSSRPEDEIMSWHAAWRPESLRHYLPTGWCFALRDAQNKLRAYFLAQPLLFYEGMTQTLWVEYLSFDSTAELHALVDLARKYARDKHLQKVIIKAPKDFDLTSVGARRTENNTFEFLTTRMS